MTGRFLEEDPTGFAAGDANLYRFVGNAPTDLVDPTGRWGIGDFFSGAVTAYDHTAGVVWQFYLTQTLIPYQDASAFKLIKGAASGTKTSLKAAVNGAATAARDTGSLGVVDDDWQLFKVDKEDIKNGYNTARPFITGGLEVLIAVLSGGASAALSKGGKIAKLSGKALVSLNLISNLVGTSKAVAQAKEEWKKGGLSTGTVVKLVTNLIGGIVNAKSLKGPKTAVPKTEGPAKPSVDPETATPRNPTPSVPPAQKGGSSNPPAPNSGGTVAPNSEVVIKYKTHGDATEFARQLQGQEAGINKLTAGEIKANIEKFRAEGRPSSAASAIGKARRANPAAADGNAGLHNPDAVIGGKPDLIEDFGGINENSSLGSQNRVKQQAIYDAVKDLPPGATVKFKFTTD